MKMLLLALTLTASAFADSSVTYKTSGLHRWTATLSQVDGVDTFKLEGDYGTYCAGDFTDREILTPEVCRTNAGVNNTVIKFVKISKVNDSLRFVGYLSQSDIDSNFKYIDLVLSMQK